MKRIRNLLLIILSFVIVLLVSAHLILQYRAKSLLQQVVLDVSDNQYEAQAKKVEISYFPAGILAQGLSIAPTNPNDKKTTLSFESAEIRLRSILHLIFRRSLEVELLRAQQPVIAMYAKNQSGVRKKGIAESVREIQQSLFKTLDVLNVKNTIINDAALTIISADNANDNSYFSINHLNIHFTDIDIEKAKPGAKDIFKLRGVITLVKPEIHLLDTTISLQLGMLKASSEDRSLTIDSVRISKQEDEQEQLIALSSITAKRLNWERYLNEGLFELDSLLANKGEANINILPKNQNDKPKGKPGKGYTGNTFIIHHVEINDITYDLKTRDYLSKKGNQMLMEMVADSLLMKEMSIVNGRKPAFGVEELNLRIKDFKEYDDKNKYQFSLGDLSIQNNMLVVKDYVLRSTAKLKTDRNNRILIKELQLNNYSLEEIFQKRLAASSINVIQPEVVLDIGKRKTTDTTKRDINEVIAGIASSISPKVNLGEITVQNGTIRLLPVSQPDNDINISGLSLLVDATKATKARTLMDLLHAVKSFSTDGFTLSGNQVNLDVRQMELLNNPRGLRFGIIEGQFGAGTYVKLYGARITNEDNSFDITSKQGWNITDFAVDSGLVRIDQQAKQEGKSKPGLPEFALEHLDLNNIQVEWNQNNQMAISGKLNIEAENFSLSEQIFHWTKLDVGLPKASGNVGKTSFNTGSMRIVQPGSIQISNASGATALPNGMVKFQTSLLDIAIGISSSDIPRLEIESISMLKPKLELDIRKPQADGKPIQKPGKPIKPFNLKRLELTEPSFDIEITDSEGKITHQSYSTKGNMILKQLQSAQPGISNAFTIGQFSYQASNPQFKFGNFTIAPAALELQASRVSINPIDKTFSLNVDSIRLQDVRQTIVGNKSDTLSLHFEQMGLSKIFYSKGDNIQWKALLQSCNWWASGGSIRYQTPMQLISVFNPSIGYNNSLRLSMDSFVMKPRAERDSFWAIYPYEKSYLALSGGKLHTEGLKLDWNNNKPVIAISKLFTNNVMLYAGKDKTKPEDTVSYRPLLARQIMSIPIDIAIDSILIRNARVDAADISKRTGKQTLIYFSETDGYISNFKTRNASPTDTLDSRLRTRFYGTDQLRLHFKQSYADTLQGFWMRARMSKFSMPEMNKLLVPLIGLKIHSGQIDSMLLVANGNDYFAYGTMDLRYHHLKARLLPRPDNKKKLTTGLANFVASIFLHKKDNGRTDLLYQQRLRKRGIFNFWGKIALEGLLTNIGVRRDRKETKKFKKSIKQYHLPEKYWQDDDD